MKKMNRAARVTSSGFPSLKNVRLSMKYALLSACSLRAWYSLWMPSSILISSSWEFWMMRYTFTRLVGVVDHAADVRMGLPQSEEQRAAAHERFTYVSISEKLPGNDSVRTGAAFFPPTHGKQGFSAGLLFFFLGHKTKIKRLSNVGLPESNPISYFYRCYSSSVSSRCCSFGSFSMRRSSRRMISPTSSLMR